MNEITEIVKIGGPVLATAFVFLFFIDRSEKRTINLIENHMRHSTEAINRNTKVLEKLSTLITKLNGSYKQKK